MAIEELAPLTFWTEASFVVRARLERCKLGGCSWEMAVNAFFFLALPVLS